MVNTMSNYNFRSGNFSRGELEALYREMSRRANARLRRLEKADRAFWAYDKATIFTQRAYGSNRFPSLRRVGSESDKGLIRVLEEVQTFLSSKSSTVSGSKSIDRKILNTFKRKGVDIKDSKEFFNFLQSEQFKKLSNKKISSSFIIDYYTRSSNEGKTNEEIVEELEKFRQGEIKGVDELFKRGGFSIFDVKKL